MSKLAFIVAAFSCAALMSACNDTVRTPEASASQPTKQSSAIHSLPRPQPLRLAERPTNDTFDIASDPFVAKSWAEPAPPTPVAPVPSSPSPVQEVATPVAPPLPFTFAGKLEQTPGQWTIYLTRGNESFALSKGDTFDNVYRLVEVDAGKLVIEYLPLSTKQTLPIGAE